MWEIDPSDVHLTYETIELEQLRQWARAKGLVVVESRIHCKRPWIISKQLPDGNWKILYKGTSEKKAIWELFKHHVGEVKKVDASQ